MAEGMNCICHYDGVVEKINGKFNVIGGEAKLRYIRKDVTFSQFLHMMKDLCGSETFVSVKHLAFGVACKVEDDCDYQAMFTFYQSYPRNPLEIWMTKESKVSNTTKLENASPETELSCLPPAVGSLMSHRHSRKTSKMNVIGDDNVVDVVISTIDVLPAQYIFMIKSFSSLPKNSVEKYDHFIESGGYKWKLSLYPNGNENDMGIDHISLYLAIVDTNSLPSGWEVDVIFRFFLFDHIREKYITIKESAEGRFKRFHELKTEWGFSQLIPLTTFNDPCNGYLVNDTCIFGANIFVSKCFENSESLMVKEDIFKFIWTLKNVSEATEGYSSVDFVHGMHTWELRLYPAYMTGFTSLYLYMNRLEPPFEKLYATFLIRLREQKTGKHIEYEDARWFDWSGQYCGRDDFIRTEILKDPENSFLVNDTCIIELELQLSI